MRARECRMAAQIDFDRRSEPAEIVSIALLHEKRGLGEVHLARDVKHPANVGGFGENTDAGGVAGEGAIGERVDLRNMEAHASKSIAVAPAGARPNSLLQRRMRSRRP